MIRLALVSTVALVAAAGCGLERANPCAKVSGTCLAIHFEGDAEPLDAVELHVKGGNIDGQRAVVPKGGAATGLPFAVAVALDGITSPTPFVVEATALLKGLALAERSATLTIGPGQHASLALRLDRGTLPDASVLSDGNQPTDGKPPSSDGQTSADLGTVGGTDLGDGTDLAGASADLLEATDLPRSDLIPVKCVDKIQPTGAVITAFEGGAIVENVSPVYRGTYYSHGDGSGTQSPAMGMFSSSTPLEAVRGTSTYGLHTTGSGHGSTGWGGFYVDLTIGGTYSLDASAYQGVSFWAKGTAGYQVTVDLRLTTTHFGCPTCTTCFDTPSAPFTPTSAWTYYELPWSSFVPGGWGVPATVNDPSQLGGIGFTAHGDGWDFWVDDLAFY